MHGVFGYRMHINEKDQPVSNTNFSSNLLGNKECLNVNYRYDVLPNFGTVRKVLRPLD